MAEYTIRELEAQAVKAGRYFARGLSEHKKSRLGFRVGDVVVVVARDVDADELARRIEEGEWMNVDLPSGERLAEVGEPVTESESVASGGQARPVGTGSPTSAAPSISAQLVPRFHEPQDRGKGSLHLHVKTDMVLGRRVRAAGQCLCSKKRGSAERPATAADTTWCSECVKVATDNGLI